MKWPVWAVYSAERGTSSPVLLTMGPDVLTPLVCNSKGSVEIISLFVLFYFYRLYFLYSNGFS